jgi:hypothetical protein
MRRHVDTMAAAIVAFAATLAPALAIGEERATDDCLAGPSGAAPHGSHWYYRTDRQWQRKCWYLGKAVRNGAASDGGAHNTAAETVGHPAAQPAAAAPAPAPAPTPGASGDAGSNRECDIEQSVLNYRRVLATVFQSDATTTDVDAQAKELAAKGCLNK